MKKLSEYAKEQGIDYKQAWNSVNNGTANFKTQRNKNGRIFVVEDSKASKLEKFVDSEGKLYTPVLSGKNESKASSMRRNAAATSRPTDEFANIRNGIEPFSAYSQRRGSGDAGGMFPLSEAIYLCQKAYYNFAVFRNIIDAMTEFSCSNIYFQGGTSKARNFFSNFLEEINIKSVQDKFFRELYRSGNAFFYRFEVKPEPSDIARLNKIYGCSASKSITLPIRYIVINPYDIGVQSNIVFGSNVIFFKRLNGYEIHRLRAAETEEEKLFFQSLPESTQKQIESGAGTVIIPLNPERLYATFLKKQDYEPMAVPPGYPVLKDIEWKQEMKNVDMAVARTMNQVVLLVNMGYESKDGSYMFDGKAAEAMRGLFESESVGKVLVADFTTKLTWAIPSIGDFLDPKKYEIVNQDIKEGLNYILTGTDSKFANQFISVKLFVERLKQGREMFLNEFLIPEMKKIAKTMGFQSCPTPKFEDIDLRDESDWERIVTQLSNLGILTPPEAIEAINTGRVPTKEESLENQQEYRTLRDKGFYEPLTGGPFDQLKIAKLGIQSKMNSQVSTPAGRPNSIKTKQTTKKPGVSKASNENFDGNSLSKIKDELILATKLREMVKEAYIKEKNIEEVNEFHKNIIDEISEVIIANSEPEKWKEEETIKKYLNNPVNDNIERIQKIDAVAALHGISPRLAVYLVDSEIKDV